MLSQEKWVNYKEEVMEGMRNMFWICVFLSWVLLASCAWATVFEFNLDGTINVYEAQDFQASMRHHHQNIPDTIITQFSKDIPQEYDDIVSQASEVYGVSADLIHAIIEAESAYDSTAISKMGAAGLMQLMPDTAERYGVKDTFSPVENINGGVKYLKFLLDHYHGNIELAVAAYNAGEGAVDRYEGIPPYPETRAYVQRVVSYLTH